MGRVAFSAARSRYWFWSATGSNGLSWGTEHPPVLRTRTAPSAAARVRRAIRDVTFLRLRCCVRYLLPRTSAKLRVVTGYFPAEQRFAGIIGVTAPNAKSTAAQTPAASIPPRYRRRRATGPFPAGGRG